MMLRAVTGIIFQSGNIWGLMNFGFVRQLPLPFFILSVLDNVIGYYRKRVGKWKFVCLYLSKQQISQYFILNKALFFL